MKVQELALGLSTWCQGRGNFGVLEDMPGIQKMSIPRLKTRVLKSPYVCMPVKLKFENLSHLFKMGNEKEVISPSLHSELL